MNQNLNRAREYLRQAKLAIDHKKYGQSNWLIEMASIALQGTNP